MTLQKYADIVIVGGGLVGRSIALLLAQGSLFKNCKMILIENRTRQLDMLREPKLSEPYRYRVSALNQKSYGLFEKMFIRNSIEDSERCGIIKQFVICEKNVPNSTIRFDCGDRFAFVIENDLISSCLNQRLSKCGNLEIINGHKAIEFKRSLDKQSTITTLDDGTEIESSLLIGADGSNSRVRKAFQIECIERNYKQSSIVATVKIEECVNETAWQQFQTDGPIALLPLNRKHSSIVWSTPTEHAKKLLQMDRASFVNLLNEQLQHADVPKIVNIDKRYALPLHFAYAANLVCAGPHQAVLVGDAAHCIHPLAGQGLNIGLADIRCLYDRLSEAQSNGSDIFDWGEYLRDYETERQRSIVPLLTVIETLNSLFRSDLLAASALRRSIVHLVNNFEPLKNCFIRYANI